MSYEQNGDNEYARALAAVGHVLEPYDSDNLIPAFGFGAELTEGEVDHCFSLNGGEPCQGVDGVLQAYRDTLQRVTLSGKQIVVCFFGQMRILIFFSDE